MRAIVNFSGHVLKLLFLSTKNLAATSKLSYIGQFHLLTKTKTNNRQKKIKDNSLPITPLISLNIKLIKINFYLYILTDLMDMQKKIA